MAKSSFQVATFSAVLVPCGTAHFMLCCSAKFSVAPSPRHWTGNGARLGNRLGLLSV